MAKHSDVYYIFKARFEGDERIAYFEAVEDGKEFKNDYGLDLFTHGKRDLLCEGRTGMSLNCTPSQTALDELLGKETLEKLNNR